MFHHWMQRYFPYLLFFYHLLFALPAWQLAENRPADSWHYWFLGRDLSDISFTRFLVPGTEAVNLLTFPLVRNLHLPFWVGFVLFSAVGGVGFIRLYRLLDRITAQNSKVKTLAFGLLLLPSLHLWTSMIGKEPLIFVALVYFTAAVYEGKFARPTLWLSWLAVAWIRPHVAAVLLAAVLLSLLWSARHHRQRLWLWAAIPAATAICYLLLKKVARLGNDPWARLQRYYEVHIRVLKQTRSYVPLDEYSLPSKMFTFYFRPLPFEKMGWVYHLWSFENALLLILSGVAVFMFFRHRRWRPLQPFTVFAGAFLFLFALMYVYGYANYGLIARTKVMAMPVWYGVILYLLNTVPTSTTRL